MIDFQQLEAQIQSYIGPDSILGLAIAIVQRDKVLYRNGFGVTSVEDGALPITPQTLFSIGSTSKTINALLIMRLVERGVLNLDRPVVDYLPGYTFTDNPVWGQRITLRHLLSHTAGLACGGKAWGPRDPDALRRWVWEEMAHFAFVAEPGRTPYYANGPSLAGHVAEAVTGKEYTQLVAEEVFTPLGMCRSTYDRRIAMTYPLALPHARDGEGKLFALHLYADNPAGNPEGFCLSTVDDLSKPLMMLLNRGQSERKAYLHLESVTLMQTSHGDYRADAINDVRAAMLRQEGLGLSIGTYKGVPTVGHSGMLLGMMTMFDLFPTQGIGVVSLVNYCDMEKRNELLFHIYDQLLMTPATYHFPSPQRMPIKAYKTLWPSYEGVYLSPFGELVTVVVQEEQLTAQIDEETHNLIPMTTTQYYSEDETGQRTPFTFLPAADGATQTLLIYPDLYNRIEIDPHFRPDVTTLAAYIGLYANYKEGHIIEGFYVGVKGEGLVIYPAEDYGPLIVPDAARATPCRALSATRFASASGLYDFTLAPDGTVAYVTKDLAFRYRRIECYSTKEKV